MVRLNEAEAGMGFRLLYNVYGLHPRGDEIADGVSIQHQSSVEMVDF